MEWYESDVRALEQARVTRPLPPRPAVFYGSSSIRMWSSLAQDLGSTCAVNLGFGGSTLEACVWFFERLVPPVKPSSLIVYAGDNDIGDGRTPRQVSGWFGELRAKVNRDLRAVPFGFVSIKPSPARAGLLDRIAEANEAIRGDIAGDPRAFYVNVFTPMLGRNGQPRPELFLDDGLHLSRAGYALWAQVLAGYRDRIFTKDCGSSHTGVLRSPMDGPPLP
jgi:lysophospholipase L1-like esterase